MMKSRCRPEGSEDLVVRGVGADPEPENTVRNIVALGPVMKADPRRPESANFLQLNGGVPRIEFHKLKVFVRQPPDSLRQLAIVKPKFRGGEMVQSGVQRPASKSSLARRRAASNRPEALSDSICRSQASAR